MSAAESVVGAPRARVVRWSALALTVCLPWSLAAQVVPKPAGAPFPSDPMVSVPQLPPIVTSSRSELVDVVSRFQIDEQVLNRRYDGAGSPDQRRRKTGFYESWRARLREIDFGKLTQEGKADYLLLDNYVRYQQDLAARQEKMRGEVAPLMPFADTLLRMHDDRRNLESVDGPASARVLAAVTREIDSLRALIDAPAGRGQAGGAPPASAPSAAPRVSRTVANRAADNLDAVRGLMTQWYRFYDGYDPLFSWWVTNPYQKLDESMQRYAQSIRQRLVGIPASTTVAAAGAAGRGGAPPAGGRGGGGGGDNSGPIIGDPIGAEGLEQDLRFEMIPYTAEELIAIAEREYAFSLSEAKKAAREMGFGDDWKKAMDKVKDTYVEPGKQPEMIRNLARQAEAFFDKHDWITIPALAREDWRMEMISPERQRVSPFFLGGESIQVSYPTDDMTADEKMMSMRGNNPHFSHATVFHELNPGHHLQGFMTARYNSHRRIFSTPFWNEGQALYWEMFLWDHDFHVTPEDRMGALFWRMHRSARIIFSLNFHVGKMTPEQAIQFLVDTVNFERANAEGEVRRSFNGSYSPLYQAAYMLGGLQMRAMYKELVTSKKMTERAFHDAVIQSGPMPMAMVRARLAKLPLSRDGATPWRFADDIPPPRPFPVRGMQ
ncbi:MAG: DUF885 family protein [Gemmatimonadaceae bacterium]|nr:DUF885 family protein [Gemmatimonadaceae bacterium]